MRLVPRTSGAAISIIGAQDPDDASRHVLQVAASTTANWAAGTYSWASWVVKGTEVYDLSTGTVKILPDPRTANAPLDLRSDARKALDDALVAYQSWNPTVSSYSIGGRSMSFSTRGDLLVHINALKADVQREERAERMAEGMPDPRKVYVRLGRV